MWYLGCLFVLIAFLLSCASVGAAICRLMPWRIRFHATAAFAPILGLAVFVFISTAVGWVGSGFQTWICLPLTILVVALSLPFNEPKALARMALTISSFSVLSALGWLFSIIRFGAFNPYNDTFTYLVHAQWLQTHSFRTPVIISGQYPALTQVALYQTKGLRMGASFLFGWVQATFGVDWSYLIYPAVVLLPVVACAVALAGMAFFVVRKGRLICLLGGAAVGTTLSGTGFGALFGFLPQTYGIAFAFGFLGMLGMYLPHLRRGVHLKTWAVIPCSIPLAALFFCYPEMSPFVAASAVACFAGLCLHRPLIRPTVDFSIKLVISVLLLLNFELFRIWQSLLLQATVVAGSPVSWTPDQFFAHAAGFLSGAWDGAHWAFGSAAVSDLAALLFMAGSCSALVFFRRRIRTAALIPTILLGVPILLGFLYFRYVSPSPWSEGVGQSWSQFKLTNWISIFVLFVLVCGSVSASYGPRWARFLAIGWLLVWQFAGLVWNYRLADIRTTPLRQDTGFLNMPFDAYTQVRQVAKFAGEEPIFLNLGGPYQKDRQMVLYFLQDHPLASDWSDDTYLSGVLPVAQRTFTLQPSMWVLSPADSAQPTSREQRVGRLGLSRAAASGVTLIGVSGGYGEETDGKSSWHWTAHSLQYHYRVFGPEPLQLRGRFVYLPASADRTLRISVTDSGTRDLQELKMQETWTQLVLPSFKIGTSEFSINFDCTQSPVRLGVADPRLLGFLIKDFSLEVIE